jgi:hypothetical protein
MKTILCTVISIATCCAAYGQVSAPTDSEIEAAALQCARHKRIQWDANAKQWAMFWAHDYSPEQQKDCQALIDAYDEVLKRRAIAAPTHDPKDIAERLRKP